MLVFAVGASLVVQWLRIHLQCRAHWLNPWSRKMSYTMGPLSPWATATEPTLEPKDCAYWAHVLQAPRPTHPRAVLQPGARAQQLGEPCSPQPETAPAERWGPSSAPQTGVDRRFIECLLWNLAWWKETSVFKSLGQVYFVRVGWLNCRGKVGIIIENCSHF